MTVLVGLVVGLVLGLTGAGGSVLAVPLFVEVLHSDLDTAVGVSLGVVAIGALFGTLGRIKSGTILVAPALAYAVAGMLMAPLGRRVGDAIPDVPRIVAFSFLVVIVAFRMWRQASQDPESTRVVRAGLDGPDSEGRGPVCRLSPTGRLELKPRCLSRLAIGGAVTGLLSGIFGVGGGFVIVPSLVLLTEIDMHRAVATSLLVITLVASSGFASYVTHVDVVPLVLLRDVSLGVVLGMGLGTVLAKKLAGPTLVRGFVGVLLALTGWMLVHTLIGAA